MNSEIYFAYFYIFSCFLILPMKRKLIKQGHSTLTITLPNQWIKDYHLQAGDEIDLTERDNGLFFSPSISNTERTATINITDMDVPTMWKHFMALYREGYTTVTVEFAPDQIIENPYKFYERYLLNKQLPHRQGKQHIVDALQGIIDRFIGFEIISHGKHTLTIKQMGVPAEEEFHSSFRRLFLLVSEYFSDTLTAMQEQDKDLILHLPSVDISIDKFHDHCVRLLNQAVIASHQQEKLLFSTAFVIELLADELKNIANHLIKDYDDWRYDAVKDFFIHVQRQWETFSKLFHDFSDGAVAKLSSLDKARYKLLEESDKKTNKAEKELIHHLRVINKYINALLELSIEYEYSKIDRH